MYSLPVRLAGSPVHFSFDSTPNLTAAARRISNIDASDFWKSASNAPAQPSHTSTSCLAGSNVSSAADVDELRAAGRSRAPRCCCGARGCCTSPPRYSGASPFETRPRRDADQDRQVLDADRALVLAGAAGRALPQHLLGVDRRRACVSRSPASSASCVCRMIVFGFSSLPGAPRRTVHLAAAALDAGERVEHDLAAEILHRLEADLLLLEVEVRQVAELGRLQEHRDRRQHQVEVLRRRESAPGTPG